MTCTVDVQAIYVLKYNLVLCFEQEVPDIPTLEDDTPEALLLESRCSAPTSGTHASFEGLVLSCGAI